MEEETPTYMKGFNDGYKLSKYQPELYAKLQPSLNGKGEYERGILEGAQQAEKEIEQKRVQDLGQLRKPHEKTNDLER